jgi:polyisoprenoid-binding protein YceI
VTQSTPDGPLRIALRIARSCVRTCTRSRVQSRVRSRVRSYLQSRAQRYAQRYALPVALVILAACLSTPLRAQQLSFEFDRQHTQVNFLLTGNTHDVHGTFALKRGNFTFDPTTGKASGEIVIDATTGETGNQSRDRRMHKEILETEKYPEIVFIPDHAEGQIPTQGTFELKVHGIFRIHGADHDLTVPVQANRTTQAITASIQFQIPYAQWGIKNPSNFLLRVSDKVEITIHTTALPKP